MTKKTRLSVILLSTPVLAFVLVGGLMGKTSVAGDQEYQHLRVFQEVVGLVMSNYVEDVKVDKIMEGAMRGLADGLDPDSAYLTPAQARAVEAGETLADGDVGLELTRQYYLRVIAPRDGSPAARAGLQTGDYVRAIDGRPTRDMSVFEGSRLLRGAVGSKVVLTVIRGNAAEPRELPLVREKSTAPAVTSKMIGADVGYVRVASFRAGAAEDLKRHAADLARGGAKSLIIDLRRTAEGPIEQGHAAARAFVKSGTLGIRAGRDAATAREAIAAKSGDGAIDLPVTLLVTTGTAGAAELFAAALDGNARAQIVGERSLGRAGVQKLVKLPDNRALWLTYARYLTPAGDPIHGKGLQPDVPVEEPDVEFGAAAPTTDPILDAALEKTRAK
ncbi:MAG TPA: S41 family peptidase [Vicinamibacterales bacterium]|jgi:carboxyl-terminal processing protease|nr:S41 family peptidase [Vicinamibacterales bacterium]